ncbi:MAG: hypothetical protein ACK4GJ_04105 [bacterium]
MKKLRKSKKGLEKEFETQLSSSINTSFRDKNVEDLYRKIKIGSFNDYTWALENYKNFKNISKEEELKIIYDAQNGRMEAKIILISLVFPYIIKIYKLFSHSKMDYLEGISDGVAAALEAIQKYDLSRYNVRFSTYASYWIYHSLIRNTYHDTTVKVPLSVYLEYSKFIKSYENYVHKYKSVPTFPELIEYMFGDEVKQKVKSENPNLNENDDIFRKIYKSKINELREKYSRIARFVLLRTELSLQDFKFSDSPKTVEEFMESSVHEEPENNFEKLKIKESILKAIMNFLEDEEKIMIIEYYGLFDGVSKTLDQISELIFSVYGKRYSKERIRQKIKSANLKLKKYLSKDLKEFLVDENKRTSY